MKSKIACSCAVITLCVSAGLMIFSSKEEPSLGAAQPAGLSEAYGEGVELGASVWRRILSIDVDK